MSAWPLIPLGEIFEIARGGSPRPIDDYITDADDGVNWISIADASDSAKYIERTKRRIRPEGVARSRLVAPGDFLLTNSMSFGRPYIMRTSGCIHDGWLVLGKKRDGIDPDFFFRLLGSDSVYAAFSRLAAGATVKNLNIDLVKGVTVPVPPIDDQRRIAAILDQADALRVQHRQALAELDKLAQAVFVEMFGDPIANPKGWPSQSLTEVCHTYSGGTPSKANTSFWEGSVPWFSAKDMKADDLFDSQDHISEAVTNNTSLKLLRPDTVVIVVRGMILAHTFPVCVLRVAAAINQDLKALIPKVPLDAQFLANCLRVQAGPVLERVSEAGHGTKRLDAEGLHQISVILPPPKEQADFAKRVKAIQSIQATHRAALAESDALFASLQQRAFTGTL
jgi:type I restriction enzyme S subunit